MEMKPFKPIALHTYDSNSERTQLLVEGSVFLNPYEIASVEEHSLNKNNNWKKFFPESERAKVPNVGSSASLVTMKSGKKYQIVEPPSYIARAWEDSMK